MDVARIGGLDNGGVAREALTDLDTESKVFVINWAEARGLTCLQDEAANLFIRLEGSDPDADPVFVGSHLDSQPTGGKFDGAYGVVAGLEILAAIQDAGVKLRRPVEVASWTNEEGSRFLPGATGSSAFAGTRDLAVMGTATTADGKTVSDEIARSISATPAPLRLMSTVHPCAYLEAHIEQGPVLEAEGIPVGIVDGIQGIRRIAIEFRGQTAHAGTTPHAMRADALVAATQFMSAAHEETRKPEDTLRLTFGRIEVQPNSPNTVPDFVRLTIDLRHPSDDTLDAVTARLEALVQDMSGVCSVSLTRISAVAPVRFDAGLMEQMKTAASVLGIPARPITSGAGHDALHLARVCPSAMLFIPCAGGISHHESESATPGDAFDGARVLAHAVCQVADSKQDPDAAH